MKKIVLLFTFLTLMLFMPQAAQAQDLGSMCSGLTEASYDSPPITAIVCSGVRILNYAFYLIGGVFLIMFLFGMYKYANAWGDPKGVQGAKDTVTNALIGVVICFSVGTIIIVIGNVFGLDSAFVDGVNPFNKLLFAICEFLGVAATTVPGCP